MKKILFGLLALSLSATTFTANPGTPIEATMSVEAKLTVLDAVGKLVIEELTDAGTWEVVSSTVGFDHGTVTRNTGSKDVPTPSILKNFRVRRLIQTVDNFVLDSLTPDSAGQVTVKMTNDTGTTGVFAGKLKSAGNEITHTFRYTPLPIIGVDKTAKFNIESEVAQIGGSEPAGVYSRVETVKVNVSK